MAGKLRLELHPEGFNQARSEATVQAALNEIGERIAAAAGGEPGDFEVHASPSPTRARAVVITATVEAMKAEATDRALSRAFDAGRS